MYIETDNFRINSFSDYISGFSLLSIFVFVVHTAGFFRHVGIEYLGLFVDTNFLYGMIAYIPSVVAVVIMMSFLFRFVLFMLRKVHDDGEILKFFVFMDGVIGVAIIAGIIFLPKDKFPGFAVVFYSVSVTIIFGVIYIQYCVSDGYVNKVNIFFFLIVLYNGVLYEGERSARYSVNESERRYILTLDDGIIYGCRIVRSGGSGSLISISGKVEFIRKEKIQRIRSI